MSQPVERLRVERPDGAVVVAEVVGEAGHPLVLLNAGAGCSMDWWRPEFCAAIAARGLRVIRYDQRGTGETTLAPRGHRRDGLPVQLGDALAVLDAAGAADDPGAPAVAAHWLGFSSGGWIAQLAALDHAERVSAITLVSTRPAGFGEDDGDLPGPTDRMRASWAHPLGEPDWGDDGAVVDHLVDVDRDYAGDEFDEAHARAVWAATVRRSPGMHREEGGAEVTEDAPPWRERLGELRLPVTVLHGTADPLFPLGNGEALAREIPGRGSCPCPALATNCRHVPGPRSSQPSRLRRPRSIRRGGPGIRIRGHSSRIRPRRPPFGVARDEKSSVNSGVDPTITRVGRTNPNRVQLMRFRARFIPLAVAAAVTASLVLVAQPSVADTAPPVAGTPETVSTDSLPTVQIDGVVWDQEVVGNTVFAGGDFQTARPAGSAPGANTVSRRYLLSYDLQTGVLNPAFNPGANARIRNMALSPDGSRLYVVGSFTSIAGATRYRIAAFDTATGALTSFRPVLNGKVNAVAATNSTVYLVGQFTVADGASVSGAAAYDAVTGVRKAGWVPKVTEGQAIAVTVKSDGSKVAIGGYFKKVNGSSNPGYGLAMLDGTTGAMQAFNVNTKVRNAGDNAAISSLASDEGGVYGTGQHYGTGTLEGTFYAKWTNGDIIWIEDCHGDTYSVYPAANAVYTTSHAHYCGNIGGFPQTNPWTMHRGLAFTKTVQGTITKDPHGYTNWAGTPRPGMLHWYPDINAGTFTGLSQGGWSVAGNSQYILYGGEFTMVNNVKQQGLARFPAKAIAPNKDGPRVTGANYVPTVTSTVDRTAKITWKANWDRDNQRLTYAVIRNNNTAAPVYTTSTNSNFWTLPSMTFTDTNLTGGATYNYRIRVTDAFGNSVTGNPVNVVVRGTAAKLVPPEVTTPPTTPPATPVPPPEESPLLPIEPAAGDPTAVDPPVTEPPATTEAPAPAPATDPAPVEPARPEPTLPEGVGP